MSGARSLLAVALAATPAVAAPDLPRHPDILPGIVMTMAIAEELRGQCLAKYPELKPMLDEAWDAWPLARTTISVQVNGKDYVMPQIEGLRGAIREQFRSGDAAKNRRECEGYKADMAKALRSMPPEWLAPFLPDKR